MVLTHGDATINRLTLFKLKDSLSDEEWEILTLKAVEELTFDEIGKIIGQKYRPSTVDKLTGSAIRYHYSRILNKCQVMRGLL